MFCLPAVSPTLHLAPVAACLAAVDLRHSQRSMAAYGAIFRTTALFVKQDLDHYQVGRRHSSARRLVPYKHKSMLHWRDKDMHPLTLGKPSGHKVRSFDGQFDGAAVDGVYPNPRCRRELLSLR